VYLEPDESFESFQPTFRNPARLFVPFELAFDRVQGLPSYAPFRLERAIKEATPTSASSGEPEASIVVTPIDGELTPLDTIKANDLIVGGPEHLDFFKSCLATSAEHFILHSCFLDPKTISGVLGELEGAARRDVSIDLLWGLRADPEDPGSLRTVTQIEQVLDKLPAPLRSRVRLSPTSSGSHAKILLYKDRQSGEWEAVVSSCNFLSTDFVAIEVSQRSRSQRIAMQLLSRLIAAQQPPSGGWSAVARRLSRIWDELRHRVRAKSEVGSHALRLLADEDHYACITAARDDARRSIIVGCDLYGVAAETSVLVPMTRAAELGRQVRLFYRRPSRFLAEEGRVPNTEEIRVRGISLEQIPNLHGKFLAWDGDNLVVTSFNWLSTSVANTRARGAELGIMTSGPDMRDILSKKLIVASKGSIDIARDRELNLFSNS
jgi:hypothetical protein